MFYMILYVHVIYIYTQGVFAHLIFLHIIIYIFFTYQNVDTEHEINNSHGVDYLLIWGSSKGLKLSQELLGIW